MIQNETIQRLLSNSYCFCITHNKDKLEILNRIKTKLLELKISFDTISGFENNSLILAQKDEHTNKPFLFLKKMNDQRDYNIDKLLDVYPGMDKIGQYDTLLSCSFYDKGKFIAYNDYMGIIRHYYYNDAESFFASNNAFIVAILADVDINPEAVYETLFFRFPNKTGTFFENIKTLNIFEYIEYDTRRSALNIQSFMEPETLMDYYSGSLDDGVQDFWTKVQPLHQNVKVSFSGGSDCMTVVSLLDKYEIPYELVSFEGHNRWDTQHNIKLAERLGYKPVLINAKSMHYSEEEILEYTIVSNGFYNTERYYGFYKNLKNSTVFDGYAFFLGSWDDALISNVHMDTLLNGSHRSSLHHHLKGIDTRFSNQLSEYIDEHYSFPEINSNEALIYIQKYGIDFICSKVYAGVFLPAIYFNINNYSFFLSKKFFSPICNAKEGIASSIMGRDDYPGYMKNKKPLASIVHKTGSKVYECVMDNGISFKDIERNNYYSILKMKINKKKNAFTVKYINSTSNNNYSWREQKELERYPSFVEDETKLSPYLRGQIGILNLVEDSLKKLRSCIVSF